MLHDSSSRGVSVLLYPREYPVRSNSGQDSGIGLVEIIIGMFLLALLAVAFLPLLVDALRATVRNATVATASQVLGGELDGLSAVPRTCQDLTVWESSSATVTVDERATEFTPVRSVTGCPPADYPATVEVTIAVDVSSDANVNVEATTLVIVESAN